MKNYYKEYAEFIEQQIKLNPHEDLNPDWNEWSILYLISKFKELKS